MADRNRGKANRSDDKMSASEAGQLGAQSQSREGNKRGGESSHSGGRKKQT